MSVFLEPDIIAAGRRPDELLHTNRFETGSRLSWVTLSFYRQQKQIVTRRPVDWFPGHANVRDESGRRSGGKKTKLAGESKWLGEADDGESAKSSQDLAN